jgi:hypothetical protein
MNEPEYMLSERSVANRQPLPKGGSLEPGESDQLEGKVADLERRLRELEDERAIAEAFSRYNRAVNYGHDLRPLFVEDALVEVVDSEGITLIRHEGIEAYAAYRAGLPKPPRRWSKNLALEPLVTLDGDEARVENYFVVLTDEDGRPAVSNYGRAETSLVRTDSGWLIKHRRAVVEARSAPPDSGR